MSGLGSRPVWETGGDFWRNASVLSLDLSPPIFWRKKVLDKRALIVDNARGR